MKSIKVSKNKAGFTLVELLIVVVILAILGVFVFTQVLPRTNPETVATEFTNVTISVIVPDQIIKVHVNRTMTSTVFHESLTNGIKKVVKKYNVKILDITAINAYDGDTTALLLLVKAQ